MRKLLRNKKALSPVIATVILVSVTIVVAVSVAYWMGTLAGSYTAFEQIEMPTSYAEFVDGLFVAASVDVEVVGESVGTGDGVATVYYLANTPVVFGSETIYLDAVATTAYTIDYATGTITFLAPPGAGVAITADYTYTGTADLDGWKVHIELKNSGSADATVENIFLNAKPLKDYDVGTIFLYVSVDTVGTEVSLDAISIPVTKGESEKIILWIQAPLADGTTRVEGCTSGTRIDLKIHTAAGMDYAVQVKLP